MREMKSGGANECEETPRAGNLSPAERNNENEAEPLLMNSATRLKERKCNVNKAGESAAKCTTKNKAKKLRGRAGK